MSHRRLTTAVLTATAAALLAGVAVAPAANAATADAFTAPTVTVSDGVDSVERGDIVQFEITVKNESTETQSFAVGGMLPAGFTPKAADLSGRTDVNQPYRMSGTSINGWANLAPGASTTIVFDAVVTDKAAAGRAETGDYAVAQQTYGAQLGFATSDVDQVK